MPQLWCSLLAIVVWSGVGAASGEAQLLVVDNRVHPWGVGWNQTIRFVVAVENIAFSKRVGIHYRDTDGAWREFGLSYQYPRGARHEVWSGTLHRTSGSQPALDVEFAVRYEVDGKQYWDNNHKENYKCGAGSGELATVPVLVDYASAYHPYEVSQHSTIRGKFCVGALVPETQSGKKVMVHYTTDGWGTKHLGELLRSESRHFGRSVVRYPNANHREYFTFCTEGDELQSTATTEVQLAVVYEHSGVKHWDNNGGGNYVVPVHSW